MADNMPEPGPKPKPRPKPGPGPGPGPRHAVQAGSAQTRPEPDTRLVYSTEAGRMCPTCRQPLAACTCKAQAAAAAASQGDGMARVSREKQGRGGKTVTVVRGLPLLPDALAALGKRLRAACGAGGTCKDGVLEVQGDHAERVVAWLQAEGHRARRAGG